MFKFKKSFANRLILTFTGVVFLGFLLVYFLFNTLIDNHIRQEAQRELNTEVTSINPITVVNELQPDITIINTGMFRSNRAIVNVDTIILDYSGQILFPTQLHLREEEREQIEALANFYLENQILFEESDEMVLKSHAGHTFYMRATTNYQFHPLQNFGRIYPIIVIMYTDITAAMNLKNDINQILIGLLGVSGITTLAFSLFFTTRFRNSMKKLASYAEIIGLGQFDKKPEKNPYSEFETLASQMTSMAKMLGTYEKNQKKFFQNASHELRTPLMSIQGYCEGLMNGVFEASFATNIILEESEKMTKLITDILTLSKIDEHEQLMNNSDHFYLNDLMKDITEKMKNVAPSYITVRSDLEKTNKIEIYYNKSLFEQVVTNILQNSLRYAKDEISISTTVDIDYVYIHLFNNGPSINESDLPHIFERFYKGETGNTGLGLAIAREIITRMNGKISAQNLQKGVLFVIKLPIMKKDCT